MDDETQKNIRTILQHVEITFVYQNIFHKKMKPDAYRKLDWFGRNLPENHQRKNENAYAKSES